MTNHEFILDKKKKTDEYYTLEYAVKPILKYLNREKFKKIWCPFDTENSSFVKVFKKEGFDVIATHLEHNKDFFKFSIRNLPLCDVIISNPPYSLRTQILERLFLIGKPFALLINESGLFNSKKRWTLFRDNPFEIMVFNSRVHYKKDGLIKKQEPFNSIYLCSKLLPSTFIFEELDYSTQSPPTQTLKSKILTFPKEKGFNMGLEVQKSKISSPKLSPTEITSPNPNIPRLRPNSKICSRGSFQLK